MKSVVDGRPFVVLHPDVLYSLRDNPNYREVAMCWPIKGFAPPPKGLVGWINKKADGPNDPLVFIFTR